MNPGNSPVTYVIQSPRQGRFSKAQTCLLMTLTMILTVVCGCGGLFGLAAWVSPPPPLPGNPHPITANANFSGPKPTDRPSNQTKDGLVLTGVRLMPYTPSTFVQPGPGNWWQLDVTFYNSTNRPVMVSGYNIVLRDKQGREYWYDKGLSLFNPDGNLVQELNPGVSAIVPVVFNLPDQVLGLSVSYQGAVVPINPSDMAY